MTSFRCEKCGGRIDQPSPRDLCFECAPPTPAERIRSRILTTEQLRDLPPPEPLIDGWLNLDGLVCTYGTSGGGKTFVAIDQACHVAAGCSWWHGNAVTPGKVLYVIAEGAPGVAQRARAWEERHNTDAPILWHPGAISVYEPTWAAALAEVVADLEPKLVVIDTFARSIVGADENSARDVGVAIANLDMIRTAAGSCVNIVHHAGKDAGKGARGSTALKAAMDTEIEVIGSDGRVQVRCTKQKDSAEPMPLHFQLVGAANSVVLQQAGAGSDADELPDSALVTLDALRSIEMPGGVSSTAWQASVDVSERTFYRHRAGLVGQGYVVNVGTDRQPKYRPAEVPE